MIKNDIKYHLEGNKIIFDESRLLLNGDEIIYDVDATLKRRKMSPLNLYRAKGYTGQSFVQDLRFKITIAAHSFDEAMEIAKEYAGSDGWVLSLKDINTEVFVEGKN